MALQFLIGKLSFKRYALSKLVPQDILQLLVALLVELKLAQLLCYLRLLLSLTFLLFLFRHFHSRLRHVFAIFKRFLARIQLFLLLFFLGRLWYF